MEPRLYLVAVLVFLSLKICTVSCDSFFIRTTSSNTCPDPFTHDQCLTLQQFANSSSQSSNVLLVMASGTHSLDSDLSLSNIQNFTMVSQFASTSPKIVCNTGSSVPVNFTLTSIAHVQVHMVSFDGCTLTLGTNGNSVLVNESSFTGSGLTIQNTTNSVQITGVNFTDCHASLIESMECCTMVLVRDLVITRGYGIEIRSAATISVEDSVVQDINETSLVLVNSPKVSVLRCQFLNNDVIDTRFSGALYLGSAVASVNASTFYSNHAHSGAAIITETVNLTVYESTFINNSGHLYGALHARFKTNLTVINSQFVSNTAASGAAIAAIQIQYVEVINCTFTDNVNEAIATNHGEAIKLVNSTFHNNSGVYQGAVTDGTSKVYTVTGCTFSSNRANNGNGGAIVVYDTPLTLTDSCFTGNSAFKAGGAIYTRGNVVIKGTNFTDNFATDYGGAISVRSLGLPGPTYMRVSISDCYLTDNAVETGSGGAMRVESNNAEIQIHRSHYVGNTARFGTGGAIFKVGQGTNISMVDSKFQFNSALIAGVLNINNSDIKVDRCTFSNNSADSDGGVAYADTDPTTISVRLSIFLDNSAGGSGGVYYVGANQSLVTIQKSSFGSNSATGSGGMIAINESQLAIDDQTNVYDNTASIGDAISACDSEVTVPNELTLSEDSGCSLYTGYINRYNISEFIREELSTTTPPPSTAPTTPSLTTTESSPTTHTTSGTSHTTQHPPITTTDHTFPTAHTTKGSPSPAAGTDYSKIAVVISSVSVVLTLCLCVAFGIFICIMAFTKYRRSRGIDLWRRDENENQLLMEEDGI